MPASRDVIFRILGEDAASPAFNRAAASAEGAAARISRAGDRMIGTGRRLTHTFTLPILGIAAASVKAATDFNASMTRIQTQAGASAKDVQYLTKQVLAMKDAQFGPNELAQALYHLKSVGLDNVAAMKALRQSQDLAAVGGANLEDTTNALAGAWRTGIRGAKNFHDAAATVNAIIGAGNMTLADFNAAIGTGVLPTAKTFGLTMKDVGSALALFTDEGIDSASAATRLRMSMSLLGAPSMAADKILAGIGLTGHKLGEDLRKPNGLIVAIGELKSHLEGLNNYYPNPTAAAAFAASMKARVAPLLDKKNLTDAQKLLVQEYGMAKDNHEVLVKSRLDAAEQAALLSRAFGGGRSSSAILSLVNNYDVLLKKQNQVTASMGKFDKAVKTQAATPMAQFHRDLADLEKEAVKIGRDLLPVAVDLAKDVDGIARGFDHLSPGMKKTVIEGGLALAALGPVLTLTGRLTKGFVTAGGAAKKAALFMSAPYRAQAVSAETAALQVEQAQLAEQLAVERAAALEAVAQADKANAAAESAVRIAVSVEGTSSVLAAGATAAAEDAIEFAAAQQAAADAAVRAAAETDAAWTKSTITLRGQLAGAGRSAYALQSAMAGIGIGLTVGMLDRNASTATKALGTLGSVAAGAAAGASMGGPWGAAIGGLTAGLGSLVGWFHHTSDAADAAAQAAQAFLDQQNQAAQDLLGTLQSVNGAYGKTAKESVLGQLQRSGALLQTADMGINPGQLLKGVMGNAPVLSRIESMIIGKMGGAGQAAPLINQLDAIALGGRNAERSWELMQQAMGKPIVGPKLLAGGLKNLKKELTDSRDLAVNVTKDSGKALQFFDHAVNGVSHYGEFNAESTRNVKVIQTVIDKWRHASAAALENGKALKQVRGDYQNHITDLRRELIAMGFNAGQVRTLTGLYKNLPKNIVTQIKAEDRATAALKSLQNYINSHTWTVDVRINASGQAMGYVPGEGYINVGGKAGKRKFGDITHAQGGSVADGYFTVGEQGGPHGWELGYKQGPDVRFWSNSESRAMTGWDRVPGYATGTGLLPSPTQGERHRKLRVQGGTVTLRAGGREFEAYVQDLVIAELDFAAGG